MADSQTGQNFIFNHIFTQESERGVKTPPPTLFLRICQWPYGISEPFLVVIQHLPTYHTDCHYTTGSTVTRSRRRAVAMSERAPLLAFPQRQKLFKIVEFPTKTLFKPNKNYVAELEKKDYLGKAKVILHVTFFFYPLSLRRNR